MRPSKGLDVGLGLGLLLGLGAASLLSSGCRRDPASPPGEAAAPRPVTSPIVPCRHGVGQKLGVPFVRVCPRSSTGEPLGAPFWISAVPLACSAGAHEEVRCPPVVPLRLAPEGDDGALLHVAPMQAAVMDASASHRLCTMRFAGRLPTRSERAQAREAAGLATVAVAQSSGTPVHFDYAEIPEWVTEQPCDQPSVLGTACGAGVAPVGSVTRVDWAGIRACSADLLVPGDPLPLVGLAESCPAGDFRWGPTSGQGTPLPCGVHGPAMRNTGVSAHHFRLTCQAPGGEARPHPVDEAALVAAIRCVVPERLLDAHSG
jgi:hypothetical protein